MCHYTFIHTLRIVLSSILGTLMALKKARAKGVNEMWGFSWILQLWVTRESSYSHQQVSVNFQIRLAGFQNIFITYWWVWELLEAVVTNSPEEVAGKLLRTPTAEKSSTSLDIPLGFVSCSWHRNWLFASWSWGFQITLHIGYHLWIVAGLMSSWDEGEIKLVERCICLHINHINEMCCPWSYLFFLALLFLKSFGDTAPFLSRNCTSEEKKAQGGEFSLP